MLTVLSTKGKGSMITYWLESERKGGSQSQYQSHIELDKMASQNSSTGTVPEPSAQQTNPNPPDYLNYNFASKITQPSEPLVNLDSS